ncbi:ATP-binding cassette domain-containing protein [Lentzea sp. JNUCC 0626]|uniref:ATP-binding cassette domain-containing protein n=1 Tax=Lentzea sp. JNUCC 0626 TaxID=3367513 RepID=UPI003747D336
MGGYLGVVHLDQVSKRYGRGPWVLRDLTLEVSGLTVLTGANGTGKSTLLKIAAGVLKPTSGRVTRPASVGYVPERFPSDVKMSASSYLTHMGRVRRAAAGDVLERLGFVGSLTAPMSELSKGNAQKVALAQAFLAADVLVLDEPWTGLDPVAAAELVSLLEGRTALVSDHEGHLASAATRVDLAGGHVTIDLSRVSALDVLEALEGVRSVRAVGSSVRVVVAPDRSDQVLAEALRLGCSVRSVR